MIKSGLAILSGLGAGGPHNTVAGGIVAWGVLARIPGFNAGLQDVVDHSPQFHSDWRHELEVAYREVVGRGRPR